MKLAIGSDHAGAELKGRIINHFKDIEFIDVGTYTEESTDYPDWISKVGEKIQNKEVNSGIVICGTGIGASIVANKMKGIRAALCLNILTAEMAKRHNNANVLALGARIMGVDLVFGVIETWPNTPFDGGRHQRRLDKIEEIEKQQAIK